ncbi:MAG: glycosyltransferase [Bacteroidales bacterium]|nr:glycosyltransferase [Bacteroidales bacterium]
MKKLLIVTAFVPSRVSAGENYTRQLINDLAQDNLVDLIFFRYRDDKDYLPENQNIRITRVFRNSLLIKIVNLLMAPVLFPLFTVRFNLLRLAYLRRVVRKNSYDTVIFDFSQTFLYARLLKDDVPVILNIHDVIKQRYSRIYRGVFSPFCHVTEKYILSKTYHQIFAFSDKDRNLLKNEYSVDAEVNGFYIDPEIRNICPDYAGDYFIFFANWKRSDNSTGLKRFLKLSYPLLSDNIKIKIIGPYMPEDIRQNISNHRNIEYLGFVENPYHLISNAKALVSPILTGAGVKVKVLESLACGTHVIGFPISFEGFDEKFNRYFTICNSFTELAHSLNIFEITLNEKRVLRDDFHQTYHNPAISNLINSSMLQKNKKR